MDSHLRSTGAVTGYHIEAEDGEIGHVAGFVVDDETWAIRYIEVLTKNWWPGKKVLVSPTLDSEGELDGIQSVRRSLAGCYQKRAGVRRVCADHS